MSGNSKTSSVTKKHIRQKMEKALSLKAQNVTERLTNINPCNRKTCGCQKHQKNIANKSMSKVSTNMTSPKNITKNTKMLTKPSFNTHDRSDSQCSANTNTPRESIQNNPEKFKERINQFKHMIQVDQKQQNIKEYQNNRKFHINSQQEQIELIIPEQIKMKLSKDLKKCQQEYINLEKKQVNAISKNDSSTQSLSFQQIQQILLKNQQIKQLQKEISKKNLTIIINSNQIEELILQVSRLNKENQQLKSRQNEYKQKLAQIQYILDPESFQE